MGRVAPPRVGNGASSGLLVAAARSQMLASSEHPLRGARGRDGSPRSQGLQRPLSRRMPQNPVTLDFSIGPRSNATPC